MGKFFIIQEHQQGNQWWDNMGLFSEQPALVGDVPAHGKGLELDELQDLSNSQHSMFL